MDRAKLADDLSNKIYEGLLNPILRKDEEQYLSAIANAYYVDGWYKIDTSDEGPLTVVAKQLAEKVFMSGESYWPTHTVKIFKWTYYNPEEISDYCVCLIG